MVAKSSEDQWRDLSDERLAVYNSHDCYTTARLAGVIEQILRANGQWDFYQSWFSRFAPVVMRMQRRGAGQFDPSARDGYSKTLRGELTELDTGLLDRVEMFDQLRSEASEWFHTELDAHPTRQKSLTNRYNSKLRKIDERREKFLNETDDLRYFLFGRGGRSDSADERTGRSEKPHLDLKPAPRTRDRSERSVSQGALLYILKHLRKRDEAHVPVLHDLFHRSRLRTIRDRYLRPEVDPDGRIRPSIKMYGTTTLRLAYSDPALQQWPPEIRHFVRAAPDCVFVSADYKQLEGRVSAHLFGDQAELAVFASGGDIHLANSLDMFEYSDADWAALTEPAQDATRNWTKSWRYKVGYGGDPASEAQKLYCPCPRCADKNPPLLSLAPTRVAELGRRWERLHPETVSGREEIFKQVQRTKRYTSPWGYTRVFLVPAHLDRNSIYNHPIQHGAAMVVIEAMIELDRLGVPMVAQHHDELIAEVPRDRADETAATMREVMERPIPELGGAVLPVDIGIGEHWGELK